MKAAVLHETGGVPVYDDVDEPGVPDGHELAEVLVAGLNPVDVSMAAGATALPSIVGREGIARLFDGRRVYFDTGAEPFGSMAGRAPVDPARAFPVPDGLDEGMAVAIGIAGLAAWLALQRARVQSGETVLILGASGIVGQLAAQSAKLLGASRVVAAARDRQTLESMRGADEIVVLDGDYGPALEQAAGDGYDVVVDTIFGPPLEAALQATAPGARVVSVGAGAGHTIPLGLGRLFGRTLTAHSNGATPLEEKRAAYEQLAAHAAAGDLAVDVERVPLEHVAGAWQAQAAGSPHRKIVLVP